MDFKTAIEKSRKHFENRVQNTLYVTTDGVVFINEPDATDHAGAINGKIHIVNRDDLKAKPKTKQETEI